MAQLRLFVLGPPRLERDGETVDLNLRRALALLVYLAVTRQPQSRDALATLFWPESDQRQARTNLRRILHRLSQVIGDDILATGPETIGIAPGAPLTVDSEEFVQLAGNGLEQAVARYCDDFLAGFTLPDSPAFDEWQFFERERLRQLLALSLEQLTQRARARGAWGAAADYARRWVALDMLHEPAQRALLEAYGQTGQVVAAQRQYLEFARALEAELGVEPEQATRDLYDAIRSRRSLGAAGLITPPHATGAPESLEPAQLPPPPPLVGRERELEEILRLLSEAGGARLVTLTGPGGVGKTRLARAVVECAAAQFAHGAHVVMLADVTMPEGILPAIAAWLGLSAGDGDREGQLISLLRERELLLVLDGFEHLLDGASTIAAILAAAPRTRILVTSRERLGLGEEAVYPLVGLELPAEGLGLDVLNAAAARLLLQRARLVRPELVPTPAEVLGITRICRLVQGMPLALTLAASWAELLSFEEIANEIARNLDFLTTDQRDVPERQRSMRAVFEGSWRRLPADARQAFAQLTVFRSGFTRQAAEIVAGANLRVLRQLVNSSFITVSTQAQRYELHELLRQFAAEEAARGFDVAQARQRHVALYLGLVASLTGDLKGPAQRQAVITLKADADNLRAAWQYAAAHHERAPIAGAAEGLWLFYEFSSDLAAGEAAFAEALAALEAEGDGVGDGLAGLLLAAQGHFLARRNAASGRALMERGVARMRAAPGKLPLAMALVYLGLLAHYQSDLVAAQRLGEESLALFAEADDQWGVALSLQLMGTALARQGRPVLAQQLLQACVETARGAGAQNVRAFAAWNLAQVLASFGEYGAARRLLDEAVAVGQDAGYRLSVAAALTERAFLALALGDLDGAEGDFAASKQLYEAIGSTTFADTAQAHAGILARLRGDATRAEALLLSGLEQARRLHNRRDEATTLGELALLAADRGDRQRAALLQAEALAFWRSLENEPEIAAASGRLVAIRVDSEPDSAEMVALIRTALDLALRHRLAPTALMTFVSLASYLAARGERELPVELLALAEGDPAATFETRGRAAARAAQLGAGMAEDEVVAARQRGMLLDWRAVARRFSADPASAETHPRRTQTNLDIQLSPLIGRDHELGQLVGLLAGPARRLITLLGPGGIGKTRLGQEAALALLDSYADGVFFVALAPTVDPAQLPLAIAEPLGLRLSGAGEPREQLLRFLRQKQLLLVLDNFEHLRDDVELIPAILQAAPRVTMLVTTRERLGLEGELVYTLGGIEIPAGEEDERAMECGAVQLLLQRVAQTRPAFNPGPRDLDAIIRITRLVQGMPLAIILAASWADMLSLGQIAAEIERSLDFLDADLRALPPRQRSVRAVFSASWRRLPPAARACFARMAVFRGGFSRHAAERIAGADLRMLRLLINSSFISPDRADRYAIHELLRQFGAEHLAAQGEADELLDRHSVFYLELLRDLEADLRRRRQAGAFETIEGDLDNIKQAWGRAVERQARDLIARAAHAMYLFGDKRGRFREGADLLWQARERLAPAPADGGELWLRLTTRLSLLRSLFPREQQVPAPELERCVALAREHGQVFEEALACFAFGTYYVRTENHYGHGLVHFERALELLRALDDRFHLAETLARYGICHGYTGDIAAFYRYCREGSELARADENGVGVLIAQGNLMEALLHLGRYAEVAEYGERQIALGEQLGARNGVAHALQFLALARFLEGDLAAARQTALRGYTLSAEIQNASAMGTCLSIQGLQASVSGDFPLGRRMADEALALPLNLLGLVKAHLAGAIARRGLQAHADARRSLADALRFARRFTTLAPTIWLLPVAALLLADEGHSAAAAALLALAHTHELSPGGWFTRWQALTQLRVRLEQALGPEAFAAAWERGAQLDPAAASALLDAHFM